MTSLVFTTRFTRGRLPHWEVARGRYFITLRCGDSLPREVIARLGEINSAIQKLRARSADFQGMQRQYFRTMEKYLDQGIGQCPLRSPVAANILQDEFVSLEAHGIQVPHFSIMPNHCHALLISMQPDSTLDLRRTMTALKGRSARAINLALGRSGPLWQREWFDRWMRDDGEFAKCRDYIRANPVKAGLVASWEEHGFTQ